MPGSASTLSVDLQVGASNLYDLVCLRTASETVQRSLLMMLPRGAAPPS